MSLNRKQHPEFNNIENINIPIPEKIKLDNGIETYIINAGTQDIIKIEIVFDAGSWYQEKSFVASIVNEMLLEGTKSFTSQQISEKLDFFGAFIQPGATKDHGNITLFSLKKHLPETIKIIYDIIKNPIFPENELSTYVNKKKQQFLIEMEKVTNIARREFNEQLFGEDHPYGKKSNAEDYNKIQRDDLVNFHESLYHADNCKIILSGKIDDTDIKLLNQYFGTNEWIKKHKQKIHEFEITQNPKMHSVIEKENGTQSAIRLGKILVNKDHSDFHKLNVVNTVLGGYFGSRLMKSIREEKGYTYGINSVLVSLKNAGYFVILSEVAIDSTKNAIDDILFEIKKLRNELVSQEELRLVKNYMIGDLLRAFDGPLEISSSYRSIIDIEMTPDFFNQAVQTIKSITPEQIIQLTNQYLNEETLIKTIAGKYK